MPGLPIARIAEGRRMTSQAAVQRFNLSRSEWLTMPRIGAQPSKPSLVRDINDEMPNWIVEPDRGDGCRSMAQTQSPAPIFAQTHFHPIQRPLCRAGEGKAARIGIVSGRPKGRQKEHGKNRQASRSKPRERLSQRDRLPKVQSSTPFARPPNQSQPPANSAIPPAAKPTAIAAMNTP